MFKQIFIFMNRRLWMRVIIPVSLIVIAIVAGNLWFSISNQTKNAELLLKNQNDMLASAVEGGMFDALAIGDNDTVRTQFKRLNEKTKDLKVFVYDFNGIISFSTDEPSVGKDMNSLLDGGAALDLDGMLKSGQDLEKSFHITMGGQPFLIKNDPVLNEQRCYHCHGSKRKVLGGISVFSSEFAVRNAIDKGKMISLFIQLSGLGVIILMVWALFHYLVNKKVALVLDATAHLREKDFTHSYDIGHGDEINHILSRINLITGDLRNTIQQVVQNSRRIFESVSDLSQISESLDKSSQQASEQATTVSSAAEELSINNQSIAKAMSHSTESLNTIAAAVEQMSSTVEEIAGNVNASKEITQDVVEGFKSIAQVVGELGRRANDVDLVTDQIRSISGQVSMLALNAKIEAARAGESGKGFAVVAQEITELASDTSRSTVEADEKLEWIKVKSKEISDQVEGIALRVRESDDAISGISAAVEEQNATTSEIAQNINTVVSDISNVNTNVSEGAAAASGIAREIISVEEGSKQVQVSSHRLNENAASLSAMAEQFMELMKQFKV